MIFEELYMQDFRCFAGENRIRLSTGGSENTTVLFGTNGSGKTTILNAFTWCLYGETTLGLEEPKSLVSHSSVYGAKKGDQVEAVVIVRFTHDKRRYTLTRRRVEERSDSATLKTDIVLDSQAALKITEVDGSTISAPNPEALIDNLLPNRLHKYFFFDGERIEDRLMKGTKEVKQAVTDLMGLEIIERAIQHLGTGVKKGLNHDLAKYGDVQLGEIVSKIEEDEQKREAATQNRDRIDSEVQAAQDMLSVIDARLKELEQTKAVQEKIEQSEAEYQDTKASIKGRNEEIRALVSRQAFLSFTEPLVDTCKHLIEKAREKGEIPAQIKRQFVDDLLAAGKCICGTPLVEGQREFSRVASWRERAGDSEIEEKAIQVAPQLLQFTDGRKAFFDQLDSNLNQHVILKRKLQEIEDEIDENRRKLGEGGSEEVDELLKRREEINSKREDALMMQGRVDQIIMQLTSQIKNLEETKAKYEVASKEEKIVKERQRVADAARQFLEDLYSIRAEEVRSELDKRIKDTYQKISFKHYWPELDSEFGLALKSEIGKDKVGYEIGKSTGENQILSLAFIGSIADYARTIEKKKAERRSNSIGFRGGVYPLVIDSPFGQLDGSPKMHLAERLPLLSDQLIIVVTQDKGLDAYETKMRKMAGKVYVLNWYTRKRDREEKIKVDGRTFDYVSTSNREYDWVEIEEVK